MQNLWDAHESFLDFQITIEATHHGPTHLKKPSIFVEIGTTESQWNDESLCSSVAKLVVDTYEQPTNSSQFAMGVQKVGQLNNRFTVYKNPYVTANTILMGFRGTQFLETGAVYAPYVPLIMTPLVYDPTNFTPRKGVMTRYAKKIVRPEFYGKVIVADVNFV